MAEEVGATTNETTAATGAEGAGAAADAGKATGAATTADAGAAADAAKAGEEAKAAETKAAEAKAAEAKAAEPVDYAKVIGEAKMPEGMVIDPALAKTGGDMFAKYNLPPEAAKEFVELFAQQQKAGADGNAKAFADQVAGWKADAEKISTPEERGTAKEAALKIFGAEEVKLLETFGITNRAGFIKALAKIGKAIKDDPFVPGNAAAANGSRDARAHFPNSNMNP